MKTKFLKRVLWLMIPLLTIFTTNVWGDNFSWDLAENSSASANTTTVTWTHAAASMVLTKGTSGTNANNYLGGVSGHTHTRMYSNQVLTFTPNAGTTISSVAITCTGSGKVSGFNVTWTNAAKAISGSVATITPTTGTSEFYCTISATVEVTGVAVTYTSTSGGNVTDAIVVGDLAATNTTYTVFSNVAKASNARYAGKTAKNYGGIAMRSSGSDCGLVSTTSGGTIVSISVDWNTSTASGRTIDIYGKNTAYSAASDLFGENKGTKLGSIVYGTSTELEVTGSYSYIGLRSNESALYVDKIYIVWSTGETETYTASFSANPAGYGSVSRASITEVASGTSISTSSNTLTIGSNTVTATPASQTAQYTYAFSNWTKSDGTSLPSTVTSDLSVRANFTRSTRSYSVTTTLTNVSVKAGSTAFPATLNYGGTFSTTISAADGYVLPSTITVSGASHTWNSNTGALSLSAVTGNVSVTIIGTITVHTVTWSVNGNTSTISPTTNVPYNTTVSMPIPSVPGECGGSTFMGWTTSANASYSGDSAPSPLYNGTSPAITGDITFYAIFADEE